MKFERASGLLLHFTSLPSAGGVGDLGRSAFRFADALRKADQRWWQVLPVGPVGLGYSPYSSTSTFAGAGHLISLEALVEEGLLDPEDILALTEASSRAADYARVIPWKASLIRKAHARFRRGTPPADFLRFCTAQKYWLDDFATFSALKAHYGTPWPQWCEEHRTDTRAAAVFARDHLAEYWEAACFEQYIFDQQWERLRGYCRARGVRMMGDMPIYVSHDSADVWAAQEQFHLNPDGFPEVVGGVPPDYFSDTGQRWGNPLYRWDEMERGNFTWWQDRFRRSRELFDAIRLDHFRGFAGYWEIPAEEKTAVKGRWVQGPGGTLFQQLKRADAFMPVIAEDLGVITDDVRTLMDQFAIPGMAVLQFAFDAGDDNPYLPHNYAHNLVTYTGTHDNDTFLGWLECLNPVERRFAERYLKLTPGREHWQAISAVSASVADLVITPVQDVLGLGSEARMNTPGYDWQQLALAHAARRAGPS